MLTAPLLEGSRKGGEGPRFKVGEILNDEFCVKSVEEIEGGGRTYQCERLSDGEDVLIRCEGIKGQTGTVCSSHSNPKVQATSFSSSNNIQSEAQTETKTADKSLVVDDQEKREQEAAKNDPTASEDSEAPQRRQGPPEAQCMVYKRGDYHLEVDIPSVNISLRLLQAHNINIPGLVLSGGGEIVTTLQIFFLCIFAFFWHSVVQSLEHKSLLRDILSAVSITCPVLLALLLLCLVRYRFLHENLVFTPTTFTIRRTIEFSAQYRDSVNNAAAPLGDYPLLDRLLCSQVTGLTKDLTRAKIKKLFKVDPLDWDTVVSLNGARELALHSFLLDPVKEWLVEEINKTLENIEIRQQVP